MGEFGPDLEQYAKMGEVKQEGELNDKELSERLDFAKSAIGAEKTLLEKMRGKAKDVARVLILISALAGAEACGGVNVYRQEKQREDSGDVERKPEDCGCFAAGTERRLLQKMDLAGVDVNDYEIELGHLGFIAKIKLEKIKPREDRSRDIYVHSRDKDNVIRKLLLDGGKVEDFDIFLGPLGFVAKKRASEGEKRDFKSRYVGKSTDDLKREILLDGCDPDKYRFRKIKQRTVAERQK